MFALQNTKSARELVLEVRPTAFVDDDGDSVRIRVAHTRTVMCGECKRPYSQEQKGSHCQAIGSGVTAESAWENAAVTLGLLPRIHCFVCGDGIPFAEGQPLPKGWVEISGGIYCPKGPCRERYAQIAFGGRT